MKKRNKVKYFLIILTAIILGLILLALIINLYTHSMGQVHIRGETQLDSSKWQSAVLYSHHVISIAQDLIIVWPSYLLFAFYKKKISRKFLIVSLLIQLGIILSLNVFSPKPGVSAITISFMGKYPFIKGYALAFAGYMLLKMGKKGEEKMGKNTQINWFLIIFTIIILGLIIFAVSTSLYFYSLYPDPAYERTLMKDYEMYSIQWYAWVAVEAIKYLIPAWPIFLWYAFYKKKISRIFFGLSLLLQLGIVVVLTVFHSNPAVSTILSTYFVRNLFIKGYRLVLAGFVLVKIGE